MKYSELLKHPNWQKKRLEILQRDEFTCTKCGAKENTLHVHHLKYFDGKLPWEYPETFLVTLCDNCHSVEHLQLDYLVDKILNSLIQSGNKEAIKIVVNEILIAYGKR